MPRYDVTDYGATGDGATDDTDAVQGAIDDCAATGGGTVHLPAGEYVIKPIFLRDDITLHLDGGATLLAAAGIVEREDGTVRFRGVSPVLDAMTA